MAFDLRIAMDDLRAVLPGPATEFKFLGWIIWGWGWRRGWEWAPAGM